MRFLNELKIIKEKNPTKALNQLVKLLFHGSRGVDPEVIAT